MSRRQFLKLLLGFSTELTLFYEYFDYIVIMFYNFLFVCGIIRFETAVLRHNSLYTERHSLPVIIYISKIKNTALSYLINHIYRFLIPRSFYFKRDIIICRDYRFP